ncbi:LPS assembly lipoprotein LptE [Thalassospira sp.]|uniref:LPS assembly lipoprotein LptE n=1 Tax=Thalassospira sp. TaxID=1912094 RepID=UPI002732FE4F|nr:LPS assembly lipoprotein LptE [Thalassospira sp.]MDP2699233.1 LPS assembly lipoprotein LptE [Thalassospira sp.]
MHLLRPALIALVLIGISSLSACGFRPLYAEDKQGQSTASEMAAVKIVLIEDRIGQLTRNALIETLTPRGQVARPLYRLDITLSETTSELGFTKANEATIADYLLYADYNLYRTSDNVLLRKGKLTARTSYNLVDSDFASLEAENAARRDAARNLARQVSNQVAVGLRSAQ